MLMVILQSKNLQTGAVGNASGIQLCVQEIPAGENEGGKFNQKIIIQFPDELTAPTHALFTHLNNGFQIHRGILAPAWYEVSQQSVPASQLFNGRVQDDWSFLGDQFFAGSPGIGSAPYFLIGPNYANSNIPPVTMDRFDRDACTGFFGTDELYTNILIEEFDGYTWRKIAGNSPTNVRNIQNVVVRDTLPEGLEFVEFTSDLPEGVTSEIVPFNDQEIVVLSIPSLTDQEYNFNFQTKVKFDISLLNKTLENKAYVITDDQVSSALTSVNVLDEVVGVLEGKENNSYILSNPIGQQFKLPEGVNSVLFTSMLGYQFNYSSGNNLPRNGVYIATLLNENGDILSTQKITIDHSIVK